MLKHYLEQVSALEFAERNEEIPRLVTLEKNSMNARGILNSTITLQAIADFFTAEFLARCDFLKTFIISHSNLLGRSGESDIVTEAKTLFQTCSFSERDSMKLLYTSSVKSISNGLQNEGMKNQIESGFVGSMEERIKKNNLYVEVAYQELSAASTVQKSVIILQPNIYGIGIDLVELWNRYIRKA